MQLSFTDSMRHGKYQDGFLETLQPFDGRLLVADEQAEVLEGEWQADKVVLLSFRVEAAPRAWMQSTAYEAIAVDR